MSEGSGAGARAASRDGIPRDGEIVAGKYLVEHELGAGGMGVVVAARHLQLNQLVAVKFLRVLPDSRAELSKRFVREARAAASLRSDHVARVMDVGTLDTGVQYMVMEYLEGQTLSKLIRTRAPMPVEEAIDLILQACDALGEAHARGIVHRDVKPGNLFITQKNEAPFLKVLDFGISKAPELADEQELTATNLILGSPHYVSPEQLRGVKYVDHRTDIWALGVVLYYMLAGRRPFEAEAVSAVCFAIAADTPATIRSIRPDIPPELDDVVMRCLEKDRTKRVQSIAELAKVLGEFASSSSRGSLDNIARQLPPVEPAEVQAGPPLLQLPATPAPAPIQMHIPVMLAASAQTAIVSGRRGGKSSIPAIQVGAVVVAAGALLVVMLRPGHHQTPEAGAVEGVSGPEAPVVQAPPTAATEARPPTGVLGHEDLLPTGPVRKTPSATPTTAPKPPPGVRWGHTKVKTSLYASPGGGRVVADLAQGESVVVLKDTGLWLRVSHNSGGSFVEGWTVKDMIESDE